MADERVDQPAEQGSPATDTDEMTVAETIGNETVEVGHAGMPVFLVVCICLVLLWAMVAWKPWGGY